MGIGRKVRVAILFGGRSAEHEVSLLSARFVVESLDRDRFEPVLLGIDKSGRWLLQDAARLAEGRDPRLVKLNQAMPEAQLAPHPSPDGQHVVSIEKSAPLSVDVVFPVLHGPLGEDGSVQGLLELAGVPYVGASILGSAVGMDKDVMKRLLSQAGLPILPYRVLRRQHWDTSNRAVLRTLEDLSLPVFVKPANLGSSVGITRVKTSAELPAAVIHALEFDDKVIVEQGLLSPREIECAVLGGDEPSASVPGEIVLDHADGFYSYAAKYIDETAASITIPADLSPEETRTVQHLALRTFEVLECAGLSRVDFFLSQDATIYVNEINTLPGFTAISMFPKLWAASGVPGRELITRLIEDALLRGERRRARRTAL